MATTESEAGRIEITPTLVIGLGGTGTRVLSLFKEKICALCGPDAPVAFFGIDTDQERLPGAPLGTNEFALCDCILAPDIVKNIDLYPDIKRWWIPGVKPGKIIKGAKMKRFVGRLACYVNYAERIRLPLVQHVQNLQALTAPEVSQRRPYRVRNTIRVYVVGSLSGGSGGGFFFDIAVAVRHIIQEAAGVNLPTSVAGIVVMPRAFQPHLPMDFQREKVRANFYAGLREIENLHKRFEEMANEDSNLAMSMGGVPMTLREAPFNWIYLVDTLNEKGQNISMPQLWSMIAANLCLEVYSSVTNEVEESVFTNIPRETPYGSFSTASLRVPVREIAEYCSQRYAKELLEDRISRARPEVSELDEIDKFLGATGLFHAGNEALSSWLIQQSKKNRKTAVEEDIPAKSAEDAVFVANAEWEDLQSTKSGLPAVRDALAEAATRKTAEVEREALRVLQSMMADQLAGYGLEFMIEFFRFLQKESQETHRELNEQAREIDTPSLESRIAPALEELKETVNNRGSWIIHALFDHGKSMQRCYENWGGTVNAWARAYLSQLALVEAARVFQRLEEISARVKNSLKQIVEQLDAAANGCLKKAGRVAAGLESSAHEHVLVTNVIGPAALPGMYAELKKRIDVKPLIQLVQPKAERALNWANARIENLEGTLDDELLPRIREQFMRQLRSLDLFSAAEKHWGGSVREWVTAALDQCSPFCNWNKAVVPRDILSFTCIGVEDAGRQQDRLGDIDRRTVKLASTGDPHEIVIHAITAGYPASAISGLGPGQNDRFHYERYCQKAMENPDEHVHIDRRWLNPDGSPNLPPIE